VFKVAGFERLGDISVAHLYNLRKSAPYRAQRVVLMTAGASGFATSVFRAGILASGLTRPSHGPGSLCGEGELIVDVDQQTTVPGLYAAGNVVKALNQMSVGAGHAAIAATAIHNSLARNFR